MITNILMKVGLMSMATGSALVIIVGTITAMHSEQAFAQNPTTIISEPVKVQTDLKNAQPYIPPPENYLEKERAIPQPHDYYFEIGHLKEEPRP
jgi:hypothetical protein